MNTHTKNYISLKRGKALYNLTNTLLIVIIFVAGAFAQGGSGFEVGNGARSAAMAGNHVGVANDMSAVFWNPAALAFMPVREVHLTLEGMRFSGDTELRGVTIPRDARTGGTRDRIRLGSVGWLFAIPTVQGGLTVALTYDRPFMFDDYTVFEYERFSDDGSIREHVKADARIYGDLNRWNGSFGIQVAPNFSAGATLSLITGTEYKPDIYEEVLEYAPDDIDYYNHDIEFRTRYQGFAMSLGAFYRALPELDLGARIDAVSLINYKEEWKDASNRKYSSTGNDGRVYRAPRLTLGAGYRNTHFTLAADLRLTLPQTFALPAQDAEYMPDDMQAKDFKLGAGVGLEIPLSNSPIVLRTGYSFDQYDIYPMIRRPNNERIDWNDGAWGRDYHAARDRHTFSAGIGVFSAGIGFELGYVYQMWAMAHDNFWPDEELGLSAFQLRQNSSIHRVIAGIIYRY